jgi:hypothetical protein
MSCQTSRLRTGGRIALFMAATAALMIPARCQAAAPVPPTQGHIVYTMPDSARKVIMAVVTYQTFGGVHT